MLVVASEHGNLVHLHTPYDLIDSRQAWGGVAVLWRAVVYEWRALEKTRLTSGVTPSNAGVLPFESSRPICSLLAIASTA